MKNDFFGKARPENKSETLKGKLDALRAREEATARRVANVKQRSAAALKSLREAEDDHIGGLITQNELEVARKAAAAAISALRPAEAELADDHNLVQRAEQLLRDAAEKDQEARARELLAAHALWRREASAAIAGALALIDRGASIEARMCTECPRHMTDLAKRAGAGSIDCLSPQGAIHPLTVFIENLRSIHPEDMSEGATALLQAQDLAREAASRANWERGAAMRAKSNAGWATTNFMARDLISRENG